MIDYSTLSIEQPACPMTFIIGRKSTIRANLIQVASDRAGSPIDMRTQSVAFFCVLAFVTVASLAIPPFSRTAIPFGLGNFVGSAWIVAGFGHVMSTMWFGIDEDYCPVIAANRMRMIGSLAPLPISMAIFSIATPLVTGWTFTGHWVWQAHHHNHQNYGILSFAAARDELGRLPREVGWMIHLTTCATAIDMASMSSIYPTGIPRLSFMIAEVIDYCHALAAMVLVAAACVMIDIFAINPAMRGSPTVILFLALTAMFYVPGLWSGSPVTAFWPFAMAHGAQYLLDARLWRLRDPTVRRIVGRPFDLVFGQQARASSTASIDAAEAAATGSRQLADVIASAR